ncbi:MAG: hypothetical protein IT552_01505 [Sphingomonadaceae bacterium]|nr:hypothetical protein [Sphingomonadaceae bacterium]
MTHQPTIPNLTRRSFVGGAGAAIAIFATPSVFAESETGWKKLPTVPFRGKQDDISFVDAFHGWYGNGEGKLYRTIDGGDSWEKVWDQPGTFIRALGFVDQQVGYLGNVGTNYYPGVTDTHPLYRTADGGRSWQAVSAEGIDKVVGICSIDILPVKRIFQGELRTSHIVTTAGRVGGPATMLRSEDDGASWKVIDLSEHAGMILDVKFHDPKTGFVCASGVSATGEGDAVMLMTRDGGKSWKPVWRSKRKLENVWKMSWPSRKVGYATVQSYDEAAGNRRVVIKTVDGGKSWKEILLVDEAGIREFGVGFVDTMRGWVGTSKGGFETRDGGKSWQRIEFGRAVNKIRVVPGPSGGKRLFAIGVDVHRLNLP